MDVFSAVTNAISLLVAAVALLVSILNRRVDDERQRRVEREEEAAKQERQVRQGEVLLWVDEATSSLQTLVLSTDEGLRGFLPAEQVREELRLVSRRLSILAERGRIFFKNVDDSHGQEKDAAYRGLRPEILDQLVVAFSVARSWGGATGDDQHKMRYLAVLCQKRFTSLAQLEVGRSRVASADASKAGRGRQLAVRLSEIDEKAMHQWERDFGTMS